MINNDLIDDDKKISRFIASFFIISALNSTIKEVIDLPQVLWGPISILCGMFLVYVFCISFKIVLKRSLKILMFTFFLFSLLYFRSYIQNINDLQMIVNYSFWTFVFCLPIGIYTYSIHNVKVFYEVLLKASYWIVIILSVVMFFHQEEEAYSMFFSSSMILPLLLHINEYVREKRKLFLFLSIYELILILLFGSRGALLCLFMFLFLTFFCMIKSWAKRVGVVILLVVTGICFSIYKDQIGNSVLEFLASKNYYSRTLTLLFIEEDIHLSNRDFIWEKCGELLEKKPLLGWGLGGEVMPLTRLCGSTDKIMTPHNGFLELMLQHGYFLGSMIGLVFVLSIFRIKNIHDYYFKSLLIIFFSAFMTTTMTVGDGFLIKPGVWIYIFLFLASFKKSLQYDARNYIYS